MSKRNIIALALVVIGVVGTGLTVKHYVNDLSIKPLVSSTDNSSADLSDVRKVLGISHVVFVGKVNNKLGDDSVPSSGQPATQYAVEIIYNVKGNLQGAIKLSQIHGVGSPVQVGSTYLFAARYVENTGWYTFGIQESFQLISDDASLSNADLRALAMGNDKVQALQNAYPNEILAGVDIRYQTTYNSYASRRYDANGDLLDDTVELAAGRSIPSRAPISPTPAPMSPTTSPVASAASSPENPRDSQRVGDLRQIQLALDLYFNAHQTYPLPSGCPTTGIYTQAQAASCFTSLSADLVPTFVGALPVDPQNTGNYKYGYVPGDLNSPPKDCGGGSSLCLHYLLEDALEAPNSSYLANSFHGETGDFASGNGYKCVDSVYCVLGKRHISSGSPAITSPTPTSNQNQAPPPPPPPPAP